jgi:putative glutamine amidotransferase
VLLGQVRSTDLRYSEGKIDAAHLDENEILLLDDAANIKLYTHSHSNAEEVMQNIDAVVFTGGEDISPTLFRNPEEWHGIEAEKDFNTTRDVSDYLLLSYCIDNDIPTLCICRGAQMLGVVAGAPLIQDIPTYYAGLGIDYNYIHRYNKSNPDAKKEYISHPSVITHKNSLLYDIIKTDTLHGCPSWHHQAIGDLSNTSAVATATTTSQGVEIIEALEIPDKRFILGVQFHPEYVLAKEDNEGKYMDRATTLCIFEALARAAK